MQSTSETRHTGRRTLSRIADRLIMAPTRHEIEVEGKARRIVASSVGQFEVWTETVGPKQPPEIFVLKFSGTAGRAERANNQPATFWSDTAVAIWAVNPPGYGGSPGRASMQKIEAVALSAFEEIRQVAQGRPIVVCGSSLGTLSALCLSAKRDFAGLIVRNPPPLRELILCRFGWFTLWSSVVIANQVPNSLCTIQNAQQSRVPAVFVSSRKDRVVPPHLQDRIYNAYAGEHRIIKLSHADHADLMSHEETTEYVCHLAWLRSQIRRSVITPSSVPS